MSKRTFFNTSLIDHHLQFFNLSKEDFCFVYHFPIRALEAIYNQDIYCTIFDIYKMCLILGVPLNDFLQQ